MILARLFVPEVFGVVATLTMVISFAEIFTDAGFQKYLVQREFRNDDLNKSTNVAFWTNLGLYKTTISTQNAYVNLITAVTTSVLFSALSQCQNNDEEFKKVFFKFQRMVAILVFPLGFGLYVYRELATSILLGSQWAETADFLGMWAVCC